MAIGDMAGGGFTGGPPAQQQGQQQPQQQQKASYTAPWGSLEQQQGFAAVPGGSGQGATGTLYTRPTGGYGTMPASASPYSQALQGMASAGRFQNFQRGITGGPSDQLEAQAGNANAAFQQQQQEFGQNMQVQQLRAATQRNDILGKLMSLFTQGGGGGAENPAEGFLSSLRNGGVQGLASSPLMQQLLAAHQGQVESAFNDPGGLRSQMQRLGTTQNRYSADSTMGAQRQATLDRNKGIAGSQAYGNAWQGTLAGLDPMLKSAGMTTQFAQSQQPYTMQAQLPGLLQSAMRA